MRVKSRIRVLSLHVVMPTSKLVYSGVVFSFSISIHLLLPINKKNANIQTIYCWWAFLFLVDLNTPFDGWLQQVFYVVVKLECSFCWAPHLANQGAKPLVFLVCPWIFFVSSSACNLYCSLFGVFLLVFRLDL